MNKRIYRYSIVLLLLCVLCNFLSLLPPLRAEAAETPSWDLFSDHSGEAGYYRYTLSGKLTNPCTASARSKKSNVIGSMWFDFSIIEKNGFGEAKTYRLDCSYNGNTNHNNDFLSAHFIRGNDDESGLDFDVWLPGQLTAVDMHLELNGYVSFLNYERMSYSIERIYCGDKLINLNTDYVSSSTDSSDGRIQTRMFKADPQTVIGDLFSEPPTTAQYYSLISSGDLSGQQVRDEYGAVLTEQTLRTLPSLYEGDFNQSFSHADEKSFYYYKLTFNVSNAIAANADKDVLNTFYLDFQYRRDNGYDGSISSYRFDMSWDGSRNREERYAQMFRRDSDDAFNVEIGFWIPGIVEKIEMTLNMDRGERLSVALAEVLLGGFRINKETDYVSSAYYDSHARIECMSPAAQIDLDDYTEDEIRSVLGHIRLNKPIDLRDQYGGLIDSALWNMACNECRDFLTQYTDNQTMLQLTRTPEYIERSAMNRTIYRASNLDVVQSYMTDKRYYVQNLDHVVQEQIEKLDNALPTMPLPDKWSYHPEKNGGVIELRGLPADAQIYRKLTAAPGERAQYIHLTAQQLQSYILRKCGDTDEFYISLPEGTVLTNAAYAPGTENLGGFNPLVISEDEGRLVKEKYYKTDAKGELMLNKQGKPIADVTKKPREISYTYKIAVPKSEARAVYTVAAGLPDGLSYDTQGGSIRFEQVPADMTVSRVIVTEQGEEMSETYTAQMLKTSAILPAAQAQSDLLYVNLPGDYFISGLQKRYGRLDDGTAYHYCIDLREKGKNVYSICGKMRMQKTENGFCNIYEAQAVTPLLSGCTLYFLNLREKEPVTVYAVSSDQNEGNDTIYYLAFTDMDDHTLYDKQSGTLELQNADAEEYKMLGVDSARVMLLRISRETISGQALSSTLYII